MLNTRSTLAILTHYQMRMHAAFDKSKLPDGFSAKWRYLWALTLKTPYRNDDSPKTDFTCWIHNWKNCPPNLQVIELREVVRKLSQLPHSQRLSF